MMRINQDMSKTQWMVATGGEIRSVAVDNGGNLLHLATATRHIGRDVAGDRWTLVARAQEMDHMDTTHGQSATLAEAMNWLTEG